MLLLAWFCYLYISGKNDPFPKRILLPNILFVYHPDVVAQIVIATRPLTKEVLKYEA